MSLTSQEVKNYKEYWESITPKTDQEIFDRWLFAILSVHTTWSMNVSSFISLQETFNSWSKDENELTRLIKKTKVGLYKVRIPAIWQQVEAFNRNPRAWVKDHSPPNGTKTTNWAAWRDVFMNRTFGLGRAKTAFALEMCYPLHCEAVCMDTHMLQLYDLTPSTCSDGTYRSIEYHWTTTCELAKIPPYIARCLFWDKKQGKESSTYWSHVFENKESTSSVALEEMCV
jgi:thermostable 8-oxoguanine DNA glycosylase